jgi:hypothetical protein
MGAAFCTENTTIAIIITSDMISFRCITIFRSVSDCVF